MEHSASQTYSAYKERLFPFITEDEFNEYKDNMAVEQICDMARKRKDNANKLEKKYTSYQFKYIDENEYKKMIQKGETLTKIQAYDNEREAKIEDFMSQITLKKINLNIKQNKNATVVLVGLSGEGKSSTANTIIGKKTFGAETDFKSATIERNGKKIEITKWHYLEDDENSPGQSENYAKMLFTGVDVFLFVVNISNTRDLKNQATIWAEMKAGLGPGFISHCILVLTHADVVFRDDSDLPRFYEDIISRQSSFGGVMRDIDPRIVALENTTDDLKKRDLQKNIVLSMIADMCNVNYKPFTRFNERKEGQQYKPTAFPTGTSTNTRTLSPSSSSLESNFAYENHAVKVGAFKRFMNGLYELYEKIFVHN